jgi:GlpG protein
LFGGLSGAIYGLCGYTIAINLSSSSIKIPIPVALLWVSTIFLLLGFTGIMDIVLGASIANMAHLGGFISGVVLGLVDALYLRSRSLFS